MVLSCLTKSGNESCDAILSQVSMKVSILAALVLFGLALPYTARADCAMDTVAGMKRWAALVLEGTVVKIDRVEQDNEAAATLRVQRVQCADSCSGLFHGL